jgi:hypothetical protein
MFKEYADYENEDGYRNECEDDEEQDAEEHYLCEEGCQCSRSKINPKLRIRAPRIRQLSLFHDL